MQAQARMDRRSGRALGLEGRPGPKPAEAGSDSLASPPTLRVEFHPTATTIELLYSLPAKVSKMTPQSVVSPLVPGLKVVVPAPRHPTFFLKSASTSFIPIAARKSPSGNWGNPSIEPETPAKAST